MNLLPYRKYTFHSSLSENEIRNRLNCLTRAANAFRVKYYPHIKTNEYDGDTYEHAFYLSRVIRYRNSFLPAISGRMIRTPDGTDITVTMKFHLAVLIIMGVFAGGFGLALFAILITNPLYFPGPGLIPFAFLGVMIIIGSAAFGIEANITRRDLSCIFECEPEIK